MLNCHSCIRKPESGTCEHQDGPSCDWYEHAGEQDDEEQEEQDGSSPFHFEVDKPALFFNCHYGVFQKGGSASICYTTGKEHAELIAKALTFYLEHKVGAIEELQADRHVPGRKGPSQYDENGES
jgi:hypothetical protein